MHKFEKEIFLCWVDTDKTKIPEFLLTEEDRYLHLTKQLSMRRIRLPLLQTQYCIYEAEGIEGWKALAKTIEYLVRIILKFSP